MTAPLDSLQLTLATPERVSLSLPLAGVGPRSIAYLIDVALLASVWTVAYFGYSFLGPSLIEVAQGMSTLMKVLAVLGAFATQWLFWTAAEVAWAGQTPGKRLLRIRVVRDDGSPVGFFESAVRNLCRVIDFLPALYGVGLLAMLFDGKHRRLGDLLAGTLLVREEKIDLSKYAEQVVSALPVSNSVSIQQLSTEEMELLLAFLARANTLEAEARARLGRQMVEHFGRALPEAERAALEASPQAAEAYLRAISSGA